MEEFIYGIEFLPRSLFHYLAHMKVSGIEIRLIIRHNFDNVTIAALPCFTGFIVGVTLHLA